MSKTLDQVPVGTVAIGLNGGWLRKVALNRVMAHGLAPSLSKMLAAEGYVVEPVDALGSPVGAEEKPDAT